MDEMHKRSQFTVPIIPTKHLIFFALCRIKKRIPFRSAAPEVTPEAKGEQHLERREFIFIDDLVIAEHFLGAVAGPVKVLDRPMHEDTLERLGLGQADSAVLLRVAQCQQRRTQRDER